jgi:hypothetical protein
MTKKNQNKKDLKAIVDYLQGRESELSDTQKAKYNRLSFCVNCYFVEMQNSQSIIDNLQITFGISQSTARQDFLDFVVILPENNYALSLIRVKENYEFLLEHYKTGNKIDKFHKVNNDLAKFLKENPPKEELETPRATQILIHTDLKRLNVKEIDHSVLMRKIKEEFKNYFSESEIEETKTIQE